MTTHTPGPSMVDYYGKLVCGCRLVTDPDGIVYCPTHAAAPELLALLHSRPTVSLSGREYDDFQAWQARVDDLLARIENGG